jgi:hypothetical protein
MAIPGRFGSCKPIQQVSKNSSCRQLQRFDAPLQAVCLKPAYFKAPLAQDIFFPNSQTCLHREQKIASAQKMTWLSPFQMDLNKIVSGNAVSISENKIVGFSRHNSLVEDP